MDSLCSRGSGQRCVVVGLLAFIFVCLARCLHAQTPGTPQKTKTEACAVRDVRSRHFLIHTDLPRKDTDDIIERLELLLAHISAYWGQPMRGVIDCTVISNLDDFPLAGTALDGVSGVKTCGGITLMYRHNQGKRCISKSVVYSAARFEVVQHEVIHAYCHQTFGRVGPVWYSEGMAEMGHYWKEGDPSLHADPREIEFLHKNPPQSLATVISPAQVTGDCWQNYASRWALCHFLLSNSNYAHQFRQLGRGLLAGKDVSFERTYASVSRELLFEYLFFLEHICPAYRVDLCAWNWKKKFAPLPSGRVQTVAIAAGRGWQPSGVTVRAGVPYEYRASGAWQIAGEPKDVDADGDAAHRGRLVGILMKDCQLGAEFELGAKGSLRLAEDGDLYLRCRNAWNKLAGNSGHVTVKFQRQGQNPPLCKPGKNGQTSTPATCPPTSARRQ
jgi:hypothetical protein